MQPPGRTTEPNGTVFSLSFNTRVRGPFSESSAQPENLTLREEWELYELQSDNAVKMRCTHLPLDKFWVSVREEYPVIHREAENISPQFSTHYICEQASTCLTIIMSRDENHLILVENEVHVCLSQVWSRTEYLCTRKASTSFHLFYSLFLVSKITILCISMYIKEIFKSLHICIRIS